MKNCFYFFIIFIYSIFSTLQASDCAQMKIRIIYNKKAVLSNEVLCKIKTKDQMLFYLSKSCLEDKCEILSRKKAPISIKDYYRNIGSPGFKLCNKLGGIPQIFEFSSGKNIWQSTERCLFGSSDFVEISLLSEVWNKFVVN
jgi:hypothetical protein